MLNLRFRRLLLAFHLLLVIRLACIPYFQLIIRHRVVEDLLYLGHLVLRNIQLRNILGLLLRLFQTLLASLKLLIRVLNTITLQHCDVLLHDPNCSLFDTNVFLSVLEHVSQFLNRKLLINLGFVLNLLGSLSESEG